MGAPSFRAEGVLREVPADAGAWRTISRDDAKRRFRLGEADILLCTDAAAEGLNFQFCGALVNDDMPWNPMRVEQRIGRIDRLGQRHDVVRIVNLHYEDTVETDVYRALGSRINVFEVVVGPLQPILSQLPRTITNAVIARGDAEDGRSRLVQSIERQIEDGESSGFDIDAVLDEDLTMPVRPAPFVTMTDLDRIIASPALLAPGTPVRPLGEREYALRAPGMDEEVRGTTEAEYYDEHAESVELWSPGNPLFNGPNLAPTTTERGRYATLVTLLDGRLITPRPMGDRHDFVRCRYACGPPDGSPARNHEHPEKSPSHHQSEARPPVGGTVLTMNGAGTIN